MGILDIQLSCQPCLPCSEPVRRASTILRSLPRLMASGPSSRSTRLRRVSTRRSAHVVEAVYARTSQAGGQGADAHQPSRSLRLPTLGERRSEADRARVADCGAVARLD